MLKPKPSMSLNPDAASFPFPTSLPSAKQSINTSPTSTQSSWIGIKTSSTTSTSTDTKTTTSTASDEVSLSSSGTHPRTSSVSSVTSTSSSDKKVKSFGESWLSSPYDFGYEVKPAPLYLEAGPIGQGRPITPKQECQDDELIIFNDQAHLHLPPPPPIRRSRSPSLPILASEQSTPKISPSHAPARFIPRHTIDAASRKLFNNCLEGQGQGDRAPHVPGNAPWFDETHSFREPPSLDSLTGQLANGSIRHPKPPSVDNLADQLGGVAISPRHDQRYFQPTAGQDHHLMHHASTPNFVRGHRRSDARVRFETIEYEEEDEKPSVYDVSRTAEGHHLEGRSMHALMGASTGKNSEHRSSSLHLFPSL